MKRELRIFVPRWMDASNTNAQNLNARALLSRFNSEEALWTATHYDSPDPMVAKSPRVRLKKLWRTRMWQSHMLLQYQKRWDAVFYPGMEWFDGEALKLRGGMGRRIPVVGTLEGLVGDEEREQTLSKVAGHKVFCHKVPRGMVDRFDRILRRCDHIIAITPMLQRLGVYLFGDKVSLLPLGIDTAVFHAPVAPQGTVFRAIGAGNVNANKRPMLFVELARQFPKAEFVWFGDGTLLQSMRESVSKSGLTNISFPGTALPSRLAEEFRRSNLFILPSSSEGAPKVLQEAAACGLPRIAFGFYEPQITTGSDGYLVWGDEELFARVGELISNPSRAREMGKCAAEVAAKQDWALIAPQWEKGIIDFLDRLKSR